MRCVVSVVLVLGFCLLVPFACLCRFVVSYGTHKKPTAMTAGGAFSVTARETRDESGQPQEMGLLFNFS